MTPIRPSILLTALSATVILLAACGDPATRSDPEHKVYRHSMDGSATSVDPAQASTVYANLLVTNAYDTLYRYKYLERPYALTPNLADGMPEISEDGLTYTIRIKPGVRYVDDEAFPDGEGREVLASDFVFSLMRHFDPEQLSQGAWLWQDRIEGLDAWGEEAAAAREAGEEPDYNASIPGLQALDAHTIQIRLVRPYPQLTYTLTQGFAAILPPEALEHHGRRGLQRHTVGSGPFRLTSFSPQRAVFLANEHFREEPVDLAYEGYDEELHGDFGLDAIDGRSPPFIDRLEVDQIEETSARWNSFTAGNEIQYTTMPVEQTDSVIAGTDPLELVPHYDENYFWRASPEAGFVYVNFNLADPAIGYHEDPVRNEANHALRCAMRKAFDWETQNERFYFGLGQVYPGVIPPVVEGFNPDFPRDSVERDVEGARALLEEHGWTADNLPELEYGLVSSVTYRQMFEQFRGWLQEIGYPEERIRMRSFANFGDFNRAIRQGQVMSFAIGWTLDFPDAENTLQLYYGPNEAPGSNSANMKNEQFDQLYEEAAVMQPGPKRNDIYDRMNRILVDECATISALSRTRLEMWHRDLIMQPDREILSGFFLRFVDVREPRTTDE